MDKNRKVKQVIIIRKDLHMRRGKEIAQACHASMKILMDYANKSNESNKILNWNITAVKDSPLELWLNGIFTKICVYCESEAELLKYYTLAKMKGLMCSLITDSGSTEFHNQPTNTCVAIGPDFSDKIDEITGNLKLL